MVYMPCALRVPSVQRADCIETWWRDMLRCPNVMHLSCLCARWYGDWVTLDFEIHHLDNETHNLNRRRNEVFAESFGGYDAWSMRAPARGGGGSWGTCIVRAHLQDICAWELLIRVNLQGIWGL